MRRVHGAAGGAAGAVPGDTRGGIGGTAGGLSAGASGDRLGSMDPTTRSCLTTSVADSLRQACARDLDFQGRIVEARRAISQAIVDGCDLDAIWRESDPEKRLPGRYRRHQAVTDDDWGFTIVVLLWEPGAVTPLHDHDTWCIFGVLEGELEVTNYHVVADEGERPLLVRECGRETLAAGLMGDNGPEDTEVHRVRNTGTERAISLHVYGSDLTKRKPFEGRGVRVEGKEDCLAFLDQPVY